MPGEPDKVLSAPYEPTDAERELIRAAMDKFARSQTSPPVSQELQDRVASEQGVVAPRGAKRR